MASITGVITKAKFVDASGNDVTADIRDAASSHYLGRLINDTAPTTASVTIDNGSAGVSVTATANDWVLLNSEATAYIYTGSEWVKFAEANVINEIVVGEGTITPVDGVVTIAEIPADIVGSTGHMTLSSGVQAATPSADGDVANKKYVDDAVKDITSAMVFKGGITASSSGDVSSWSHKDWGSVSPVQGNHIWTDGNNLYGSFGSTQQVFDKSTSTWSNKTWSGLTSFGGDDVWTDGDNVYYSSLSEQYVLDRSTSTWSTKTWNGLTSFRGQYIWSDGENIYYSNPDDNGDEQYVLNKATSTWTAKTWGAPFDESNHLNGKDIWTDGQHTYYTSSYLNNTTYILDSATSTWTDMHWNDPNYIPLDGRFIWIYNDNVYLSKDITQAVLDKSTSTWVTKTWGGEGESPYFQEYCYGDDIWTDGVNIYLTSASGNYILDLPPTTLTLADATLGDINAGYTFKFTADEAGGDTFKIGDIIIANEDITHTAGATITYDASKWTIVPSGDDVDVTSVGIDAATGLKLSGGGTEITSTGTIQLNLGNTSGVAEDSTTTTKINVGVDTNNKLSANIGKLTADAVHTGTATTASAITAAVLKALLDEKQNALTLGTYLQWNSSTGALEHKDSGVTAVTTAGVKKITVDAQGHVTGASDPTKVTVKEVDTVNTVVDALTTAAPTAAAPANAISYCDYDSTTGTVIFNQIGYTTDAAVTTNDVANVVTD